MTQTYNNCAETHLDGGVMSPFVSPLSAIAQAHDPTLIGSVALRRFCPHRSDRCRVLMPTCRNSPLWQRMSAVIMFCLRFGRHSSIIEQRGHHVMCVNWNEPQVSRLQLCEQPSAWTTLEYELVDANWGIKKVRVEPATRSAVATCYTPGRGKIVPRNLM